MATLKCKRIWLLSLHTLAFVLVFSGVFLISGFAAARAESASQSSLTQNSLKGGLPAFPPFAYPENGTAVKGTVVELYRLLSRELKIPIVVKTYPYARTLAYLKTGGLDLAIIFKSPGLSSSVDFVGKISLSKVLVIPRKGKPVLDYEDLYQLKSIAVIREASFDARFDRDQNINKIAVDDYQQGIILLQSHRVDAIVGSLSGLEDAINIVGADRTEWEDPYVLGHKEWWVHFSNRSAHKSVVPALRKAVNKLYRPNLVFELYQQQNGLFN